jgi:hypothetical protein
MKSTDGPLESAKICCPRGHFFNGPVEALLRDTQPEAPVPSALGIRKQGSAASPQGQ